MESFGIAMAFAASLSWGLGDFLGGLATRKANQFQVISLTSSSCFLLLLLFSFFGRESLPSGIDIIISILAGMSGAIGTAALFKGLSMGNSALVAPVAGIIGAVVPTLTGLFIEGLPSLFVLAGFVLSIIGIWLVTKGKKESGQIELRGLGLALLAGIGFGGFLTLIPQVKGEQIYIPLVFSKLASLGFAIFMTKSRKLTLSKTPDMSIAILSGLIEGFGNIFYILAAQNVRLDIAALFSSLYPAGTVILSTIFLKEKLALNQWIGVSTCIASIMLITSG